jgi:hypothetical protein
MTIRPSLDKFEVKTLSVPELITIRQYLFLKWLADRKLDGKFCDLSNTDILCYNCLNKNADCQKGVMPASYFAKKISRQFTDCKRVLESLQNRKYIVEKQLPGKEFRVFYEISQEGIDFVNEFESFYNLNHKSK